MPALDTSFIVDFLRGKRGASEKMAEMEAEGLLFYTTEINVLELYRGAYISRRTHQNLEEVKKVLACMDIWGIDESIYEIFASLSSRLLSDGKPIGAFDELIAAITLCQDGQIVTKDQHFRRVQGLEVIEY